MIQIERSIHGVRLAIDKSRRASKSLSHLTNRGGVVWLCLYVAIAGGVPLMAQNPSVENVPVAASVVSGGLIRWTGTLPEQSGRTVELRFAIFQDQAGGAPLWSETQPIKVGADGHYSVLLGATSVEGLPQTLFQAGESRWIEATPVAASGGEAATVHQRSLLAAVPYAFKAVDAVTLAGRAAADYVTREDLKSAIASTAQTALNANPETSPSITGTGTANVLPVWTGASTLGNSVIAELGTKVGIGTASPATTFEVKGITTLNGTVILPSATTATATVGASSPELELGASSYSSTTKAAVAQNFALKAVTGGNNTAAPTANLELLFGKGTVAPTATGLSIAPTGQITFAAGQKFPGTGTITGVTATSPLTAATTAGGAVTVGLNTTTLETTLGGVYAKLAASNTFTGTTNSFKAVTAAASGASLAALTGAGATGATGVNGTSDTGNAGSFSSGAAPKATIFTENTANFDGSSIPVALNGTATGTSSLGVYGNGTFAGLTGSASAGMGVWGLSGALSTLPSLSSTGVVGSSVAPAFGNAGVFGFTSNSQSTSYAYEVGRLGVAGVWGDTTGNPISSLDFSAAVMGTTDASDGYGGAFIANSAATDALFAKNLNSGNGLYAESLGVGVANGAGTGGTGVYGFTPSPAAGESGVLGNAYQVSSTYGTVKALGPVGFVAGVWGDAGEVNDGTGTYEAGVVGTGDDITAAIFENDSSQHPTMTVTNLSTGGTGQAVPGLFRTLMASTPEGTCGIGGKGDLTCTGQVKTLASTGGGARKVETYAMQSPENWMEDFGSGLLERGVAVVKIDQAFAETVSADASYHVFITPNGDSKGLCVIRKTANSFEVRESSGGTSSLSFDYRIVARRRGYEAQRLTDVTERFNAEQAAANPPRGNIAARSPRPRLSSPGGPAKPGAPHLPPAIHRGAVKIGGGRQEVATHPAAK